MGEIDKKRPKIPKYSKERKRLNRAIAKTYRDMQKYIVDTLVSEGINVNQAAVEQRVALYIKELEQELAVYTADGITKAFNDGRAQHLLSAYESMTVDQAKQFVGGTLPTNWNNSTPAANHINRTNKTLKAVAEQRLLDAGFTLKAAKKIAAVNLLHNRQLNRLISDTYGDILLATEHTSKCIKKVVRESVRDIVQLHSMTGESYKLQAEELQKRLTRKGLSEKVVKEGFVGIVDKAGRRWDIGTYSDMVIRTKSSQAYADGVVSESAETGIDLAVISSHGAEDACANWEGVVVSLTGNTPGYPTLAQARDSGEIFHPNCQHSVHAIREISLLHPDDRAVHFKKLRKINGK